MKTDQPEDRGRERILAAARQLFEASGFHQSPMSELASIARVSVGQIYRLFSGKSDLINAIVEEDTQLRLANIRCCREQAEQGVFSVAQAVRELILRAISTGKDALSYEVLAEAHRNADVGRMLANISNEFRVEMRKLALMINPGLDGAALIAAEEMLLSCLFGLSSRGFARPQLSNEETATHVSSLILRALRPEPGDLTASGAHAGH